MKSNLDAAIAWRYLLSKKSHSAVGTISTVSVCAMAIATAAIICVLSVFNGFRDVIGSRLDTLSPDVMVTPSEGKTFGDASGLASRIKKIPGVETATPTLSDNALIIFDGQEMPVRLKGVEAADYARVTSIKKLFDKDYGLYIDSAAMPGYVPAAIAIGVASRLRAFPECQMLVFAPRRSGRVNLANPASSFLTDSLAVTGIFHADQQQFDEDLVIIPIDAVRKLLQYDSEASAIEIRTAPEADENAVADKIAAELGPKFTVKDRTRQQEMNFRMISIEKWVSFLLLGFILIIASFNIISSLSMLVIEKESALSTFSAMGLSRSRIGRIFAWESIYVSLAGGLSGIMLGLALCLAQQQWGIIKIGDSPDTAIIRAYPVAVQGADILLTLVPVLAIGCVTAFLTAAFARSRIKKA